MSGPFDHASRPPDHWNVVSVSGGKDSQACAAVALETMPQEAVELVFADTGIEHEATMDHLDRLEAAWGRPIRRVKRDLSRALAQRRETLPALWTAKGVPAQRIDRALAALHPTGIPFIDLCLLKGRFPSFRGQFCTGVLKHEPLRAVHSERIAQGWWVWSWQGVRTEEGRRCSMLPEWEDVDDCLGIWRPILRWSARDVFEAARAAGLPVNPLYKQGMARVGCMPCVNACKSEIAEIARRFPEVVDRVREWEALVSEASRRGASTWFHKSLGPGDAPREALARNEGIDSVAAWAATSRGGRQRDWLRAPLPGGARVAPGECASRYGLCE